MTERVAARELDLQPAVESSSCTHSERSFRRCTRTTHTSTRFETPVLKQLIAIHRRARLYEYLQRSASSVCFVTTDADAGQGVVTAIEAAGFTDQITFKDGFELIESIT